MISLDVRIPERLKKLAYDKTIPFCYQCYEDVPTGPCPKCFSDDLMRHLPGEGVEYGVDWVIRFLVHDSLSPVNTDEAFEESIRECYPETVKICWIEYDAMLAVKELDPISWDMAKSEWMDSLVEDGELVSFDNGGSYYRVFEIESFLDETENDTKRRG